MPPQCLRWKSPLAADDVDAVVRLWNATKRDTYDFIPRSGVAASQTTTRSSVNTSCPLRDLDRRRTRRGVGFLAMRKSYVDRLYVHPGAQRRGVGTALLAKAIEISPGGIELHTHQKNTKARAFYDKAGLSVVRFGSVRRPRASRTWSTSGGRDAIRSLDREVRIPGDFPQKPSGSAKYPE